MRDRAAMRDLAQPQVERDLATRRYVDAVDRAIEAVAQLERDGTLGEIEARLMVPDREAS